MIEVNAAPDRRAGPSWPTSPAPCTRSPGPAGSAPRRSASTAGTAAPAAATTSPWAAPSPAGHRCSAGPTCWSACSPTGSTTRAVLPVLGAVRRADQPGAAGGRGSARRPCTSWRSRSPRSPAAPTDRARAPALGRRPGAAAPAHRHHRQHPPVASSASTSSTAPTRCAAASACWSCAASRCRRIPTWPWCRRCWSAPCWPGSPRSRTRLRWSAGAPRCTSGSCCRTSRWPTWPRWWPICGPTTSMSTWPGSTPYLEFRFPRIGGVEVGCGRARAALGDRAVVRARRGVRPRRHGPLRRLLDRAAAGRGHRLRPGPAPADLQRPAGAAAARPAPRGSTWPACATGPGSRGRRCIPRWRSTRRSSFDVIDRGQPRSRWAVRPTTWCTRAGARTTIRRSTRRRPRRGAADGSRRWARLRGWSTSRRWTPQLAWRAAEADEYPLTLDLRRRVPRHWGRG